MDAGRERSLSPLARAALYAGAGLVLLALLALVASFVFGFRLSRMEHGDPDPAALERTKLLTGLLCLGGVFAGAVGALALFVAWITSRRSTGSELSGAEDAPWR